MVQRWSLAIRDPWLAQGHTRYVSSIPYKCPRDRMGHHVSSRRRANMLFEAEVYKNFVVSMSTYLEKTDLERKC